MVGFVCIEFGVSLFKYNIFSKKTCDKEHAQHSVQTNKIHGPSTHAFIYTNGHTNIALVMTN
jgi:hypothetical protein